MKQNCFLLVAVLCAAALVVGCEKRPVAQEEEYRNIGGCLPAAFPCERIQQNRRQLTAQHSIPGTIHFLKHYFLHRQENEICVVL